MDDPETISQNDESMDFDSRESICRSRTGTMKKIALTIEEAKEQAAKKRRKKFRNCMGYILVFLLAAAGILVPIIVSAMRKPPVYRVTHLSTSKRITTTGQPRTTSSTAMTTTITPIDKCERHFIALTKKLDAYVTSVVIADLNGDNQNDIVFIYESRPNVVIIFNSGNNKFDDPIQRPMSDVVSFITVADINNDNNLDIIVGLLSSSYSVQILLNSGSGSFIETINLISSIMNSVSSIVVVDINEDGKPDVIISVATADIIGIYLNKGDGIFDDMKAYSVERFPMSVYATDLNNDNKSDIIVANTKSDNISILFNQGDGTFSDPINYSFGIGPIFVTATDLNHDNNSDIILVNYFSNNIVIYLNNGNGSFTHHTNFTAQANPLSVALNDYNSDGAIDIIVPNYHSNNIQVFFNNGSGIFSQSTTYITYPHPRTVDAGDLNNDNKPDLAFGNGYYVAIILSRCDLND